MLRPHRPARVLLATLAIVLGTVACETTTRVDDPLGTLRAPEKGPRHQLAAMSILDADPESEAYVQALHRTVWLPGYTVQVREAAVRRLQEVDPEGLQRTLRQQLPRMTAWAGLTRLCEIIAEEGWVELTPALVSSWARPTAYVRTEQERPEYKALVVLHGDGNVSDVVFDLLLESRRPSEQGLRTRCWMLLHRLGRRDDLVALLQAADIPDDDLMLLDLKAGADAFGIVPYNREEILWMRKLRQPERAAFWAEAETAVAALP
ncbi:MAG: hypothetical protein ACYTG6_12905, partial [Planctomycetota bacterium]